jgi:superfamily II DNA/RNA helicase
MTSSTSPKKKPRARKLDRDRAANKTEPKKTSPRHVAAKKAAAAKRAKPVKGAKKRSTPRDESVRSERSERPVRGERGERSERPVRGERSERSGATVGRAAPKSARTRSESKDVWNPSGKPQRRGGEKPAGAGYKRDRFEKSDRSERTYSDRPVRGERAERSERPARAERFEKPTRGAARPATARGEKSDRPYAKKFSSREDTRTERPARGERPVRSERSERPVRSERSERPVRSERTERPVRKEYSERPARRPAGAERFESKRPVRASRNDRHDDGEIFESTKRVKVAEVLEPVDLPAWSELGVDQNLLPILNRQGFTEPFPIQVKTLPDAISGRDVLGRGQTGSGKTLAFGLAMVTKLAHRKATPNHPLGLVLVPTRELAMQVTDAIMPFAQGVGLDVRLIAGGMPYAKQVDALKRSVPILVATPGRLNDLIEQGYVNLSKTEITILDEADQMCDMGFFPQIVEVLDLTKKGTQRLLFSATLDKDVDKIVKKYLHDPVEHATSTSKASVKTMDHYLFVVYREDKEDVLAEIGARDGKTIFFARTQLGVERIAKDIARRGIPAGALHGGKTQGARTRTLNAFKEGVTNVLVATDVAARGIHVDGVSLVVHVDPPADPKDYLHRAGRTARAGESGAVVTLVGPRQQRAVEQMTARAGVEPKVVRIKQMSKELISITGAKKPSGIPWKEPDQPKSGRGGSRGGGKPRTYGRSASGPRRRS